MKRQGPLPTHGNIWLLLLVFVGGMIGTAVRITVDLVLPADFGWPLSTFAVNVVGALLLGLLLGRARNLRVTAFLGTGLLGGFTTYSALATGALLLFGDGRPWVALAYSLGTLIAGALASWAGLALADRGGSARGRRHLAEGVS